MPFDPDLPTQRDYIRLAIGDTSTTNSVFPDSVYDGLLSNGTYVTALINAARSMRVWLSQQPDIFDEGSRGLKSQWKFRDAALAQTIADAEAGKITDPTVPKPSRGAIGQLPHQAVHGLLGGKDSCFPHR